MNHNYTYEEIDNILRSFVTYDNCKDVLLEIIENNLFYKNHDCWRLFLDVLANERSCNVYYKFYEICYQVTFRWMFETITVGQRTLFHALFATRKFAEHILTTGFKNEPHTRQKENPNDCKQLFLYNYDGLLHMDGKVLCDFLTESNIKAIVMFWLENASVLNNYFSNLIHGFCGIKDGSRFGKSTYFSFCNYLRTNVKRRFVHDALCQFPFYREFYQQKMFERTCAFLMICDDCYEKYDANDVACKVFSNDYEAKQICGFMC
jgi:hypothetical protein